MSGVFAELRGAADAGAEIGYYVDELAEDHVDEGEGYAGADGGDDGDYDEEVISFVGEGEDSLVHVRVCSKWMI